MGMPMPCTPRSPRPRMRDPSVTTIIWTSSWGQFCVRYCVIARLYVCACGNWCRRCTCACANLQNTEDIAFVLGGKIHATRASIEILRVDTCITHSRCVDDRRHLLNVPTDEVVEQHFIAVLQAGQEQMLRHSIDGLFRSMLVRRYFAGCKERLVHTLHLILKRDG
jgi:hypothetical protein